MLYTIKWLTASHSHKERSWRPIWKVFNRFTIEGHLSQILLFFITLFIDHEKLQQFQIMLTQVYFNLR